MTRFADGFLDDYFAECDEHFGSIRHALLAIEKSVGQSRPDAAVVEELFRAYHSLKGLASMVEDRLGELLAHEMESYLRAVRDGEVVLSTDGVERLIDGTRALEETVAALHDRREPRDRQDVVVALQQLLRTTASAGSAAALERRSATVATECIFTPSSELSGRGVNVDSVRARLREHGEIVSAAPQITADGGVAFRFLLAGRIEPAVADAWSRDGVRCASLAAVDESEHAPAASPPSGHFVRVDLARLDDLMRMVGDTVILRSRLAEALGRCETYVPGHEWRAVQESASAIERQLRELRNGVMRVRMVSVGEIFRRMPFVVRDLVRDSDRRVQVALEGQDTHIDKYLVERMMDPILHLVRNAVSHGLESVADRLAAGKPPHGTITLKASAAGETATLQVADDGRGIDAARVVARAAEAGLAPPPGDVDDDRLLQLICSPGFSTRDHSDRTSGRGFGMAVVAKTVHDLGGLLRLSTTPGAGTTFTIELPLTLAITEALIASVGSRSFAVPQSAVREVIELDEAAVSTIETGEMTAVRNEALPLIRLSRALGIDAAPRAQRHVFVIKLGVEQVGIVVDRVVSQREIVVRATSDPLIRVIGVAGTTDLGDGRAVLILDLAAIAREARAAAPPAQTREFA